MMKRIVLIPVDGSACGLFAVRRVARDDRESLLRVELLHVAPLFNRHIGRWSAAAHREAWRAERSARALEPAQRLLREAGIANEIHSGAGPVVETIAATAKKLRVDEIVIGSRRQGPWARMLGGSVSSRLLEHASVPVRVVTSTEGPELGRIALPAGVGIGLAALAMLAAD
jgi:nucleotide-binding universal stress UspA family protein